MSELNYNKSHPFGQTDGERIQDIVQENTKLRNRIAELETQYRKNPYMKLSDEAKECVVSMVEFCVNQGYKMGMDEGFKDQDTRVKHPFRVELEIFAKGGDA